MTPPAWSSLPGLSLEGELFLRIFVFLSLIFFIFLPQCIFYLGLFQPGLPFLCSVWIGKRFFGHFRIFILIFLSFLPKYVSSTLVPSASPSLPWLSLEWEAFFCVFVFLILIFFLFLPECLPSSTLVQPGLPLFGSVWKSVCHSLQLDFSFIFDVCVPFPVFVLSSFSMPFLSQSGGAIVLSFCCIRLFFRLGVFYERHIRTLWN